MIKQLVIKSLAVLNLAEGAIHIIVSSISFWGMYDQGVWDWRIAASPTTDMFLGVVSLVTGFILGNWHHHNHEDCKCSD